MSKTIIAITAKDNSGKSATLRELAKILLDPRFNSQPLTGIPLLTEVIYRKIPPPNEIPVNVVPVKRDFRLITKVTINGKTVLVVIESMGDPHTDFEGRLMKLDGIVKNYTGDIFIFCAPRDCKPRTELLSPTETVKKFAKNNAYQHLTALFSKIPPTITAAQSNIVFLPHGHPSIKPNTEADDDKKNANVLFGLI